jgi:hypothetical protein
LHQLDEKDIHRVTDAAVFSNRTTADISTLENVFPKIEIEFDPVERNLPNNDALAKEKVQARDTVLMSDKIDTVTAPKHLLQVCEGFSSNEESDIQLDDSQVV